MYEITAYCCSVIESKVDAESVIACTVMFLSFPTDRSKQTLGRPDQTVPRGAVCSESTLFAIPSAFFGHITLW